MSQLATLDLFAPGVDEPAAMSTPPSPCGIAFSVPGKPVPKGRPRAFRVGAFVRMHTPQPTVDFENRVRFAAAEAMGDRPLFDGAVSVVMGIYVEPPASWSLKKQRAALAGQVHPTTKPDCDNVAKSALDACNGVVFRDDTQVCRLLVFKAYRVSPGLSVEIQPL